ncbi:hypothetical protein HanPI659440_Chr13g0496961 [Helianthus annuus]|nr:hypothetical protein HanPI659440_Chr13g0496961 [Helianthus annuus]
MYPSDLLNSSLYTLDFYGTCNASRMKFNVILEINSVSSYHFPKIYNLVVWLFVAIRYVAYRCLVAICRYSHSCR